MTQTHRYIVRVGDTDFQYDNVRAAMRKFEQECYDDPSTDAVLLREEIATGKEEFLA